MSLSETPLQAPGFEADKHADPDLLATALCSRIEDGLAKGDAGLSDQALVNLLGALCRAYGARACDGEEISLAGCSPPITQTDAVLLTSSLLQAVDLSVFEFAMWQSWGQGKR